MAFKEEFLLWQQSEITAAMRQSIFDQIANLSAEIVTRSEPNQARDQYVRGAIQSLIAVAEWKPDFQVAEDAEEETDDDA